MVKIEYLIVKYHSDIFGWNPANRTNIPDNWDTFWFINKSQLKLLHYSFRKIGKTVIWLKMQAQIMKNLQKAIQVTRVLEETHQPNEHLNPILSQLAIVSC